MSWKTIRTQPTYAPWFRVRMRSVLVGGERSQHSVITYMTFGVLRPRSHYVAEVFAPKTHQIFFVRTMLEKWKNTIYHRSFSIPSWVKNTLWCHHSLNVSLSKWLSSTLQCKVGVFKFLRFKERFRKALFPRRISCTVGLTVKLTLRFHIFSFSPT